MSFSFDDDSSSTASFSQSSSSNSGGDAQMQLALQQLQTQAEFQNQVSALTSRCWDLCYTGAPGTKLDEKRANCLKNCAERYIDVSVLLRSRFQKMITNMQQQ